METVTVSKQFWASLIDAAEHLGGCALVNCRFCAYCREIIAKAKAVRP